MEIGAVKHALNNEIIRLKKNLNQSRTQLIHKMTRKAKSLKGRQNLPDEINKKNEKKAKNTVEEILLLKKVKAKDLVRFMLEHKEPLRFYINQSVVTVEKVYAKLLQHKALTDKYEMIKQRFGSQKTEEIMLTRKERLRLKAQNKQKDKNKEINCKNEVSDVDSTTENHFNYGNIDDSGVIGNKNELSDIDSIAENHLKNDNTDDSDIIDCKNDDPNNYNISKSELEDNECASDSDNTDNSMQLNSDDDIDEKSNPVIVDKRSKQVETLHQVNNIPNKNEGKTTELTDDKELSSKSTKKVDKKKLDKAKHNKISKKLLKKAKLLDMFNAPAQEKVVDPFFITQSGENYMSLAEPRKPDEIKEEHLRGNRKMRRAKMFGRKIPTYTNFNKFENNDYSSDYRQKQVSESFVHKKENFGKSLRDKSQTQVETKLHPSWEAKKQKSGILPFQGKKVVFD